MTSETNGTTSNCEDSDETAIKKFHNDKLMLMTLIITSIVTFLIYAVPDWLFYEIPTRDIISLLLNFFSIEHSSLPNSQFPVIPKNLMGGPFPFLEAVPETPGVHVPEAFTIFYIVKACTGMQAGALLLAIILVTEASKIQKLRVSIVIFLVLFFTNALRITFHILLVHFLVTQYQIDSNTAFYWGHDVLSKVIGFFGTILFALIIEKMGIPIIDQFADWLDWIWWRGIKLFTRISK